MIKLDILEWWELSLALFDDSAGPIDPPPLTWRREGNHIELYFDDPAEETLFCLQWLNR